MQGNVVYESTEVNTNEAIHIGKDLLSGLYIIIVTSENESCILKVIKSE